MSPTTIMKNYHMEKQEIGEGRGRISEVEEEILSNGRIRNERNFKEERADPQRHMGQLKCSKPRAVGIPIQKKGRDRKKVYLNG